MARPPRHTRTHDRVDTLRDALFPRSKLSMFTGLASARSRAWFLATVAVIALARPAASVRVAFVSDTGVGNSNPAWGWTDHRGNRRGEYKVNGELCKNYKGEPCRAYSRARDVIAAAKDNGAELIIHGGDLDYESAPRMWRLFVDETIRGQGMDFLAAKGNHDVDGWDGVSGLWSDSRNGYAAQLRPTIPYSKGNCYGKYGEDFACDYGGVTFVISSVGVDAAGESANTEKYEFLDRALRESNNRWKVCVWHMNQGDMQVSYKGDSTGWGSFEICRKHGAFIVNGHAHTYSRSKEMARFGTKKWSHTTKDLRVADAVLRGEQDSNVVKLRKGEERGSTAVAVVGFGGHRNEEQLKRAPHWAKVYSSKCLSDDPVCETAEEDKKYGALMCDFNDFSGKNAKTECWVVTTVSENASRRDKRATYRHPVDRFFLISSEDSGEGSGDDTFAGADSRDANSLDSVSENNDGRRLKSASRGASRAPRRHRRRFDGNLDRSSCADVQPPDHSCAQQREWGKCDAWFMLSNGLCAKTCGRCVDPPRDAAKDYDDYLDASLEEMEIAEAPERSSDPVVDEIDYEA